jgi:2,3,4,5-tetrahydropyridine-2-carboxylate N-succinyltransferase
VTDTLPSTGGAIGVGLTNRTPDGRTLDAWFHRPERVEAPGGSGSEILGADAAETALGTDVVGSLGHDPIRGVEVLPVRTVIEDLQAPPVDTLDVYLRLHLLSHRLVQPNTINLEGIFGLLETVAWTQRGPVDAAELEDAQLRARAEGGLLLVHSVDKFPRMLDYVVPAGVRVADAARVRLGAHLAEGTVVMHEGYVNFNAGTLGTAMVEGRLSQGVVMGEGSDLGGGASVLGTLSGGGTHVVRIGERCLVGANGGIGISLGDDSVVEAGLYVTAGARVTLPDGTIVKAAEVSGQPNLLFIRNSTTGIVEVRHRQGGTVQLNDALHGSN